jgi:hypothetical protein
MYPTWQQAGIIENAVECYHKLGIQCPRSRFWPQWRW